MKIEVNYNELYNLGDYMEKMFEELKKDLEEINIISESLRTVLQGSAQQTISTRMKNFNSTQFSKIVNYTHLLGNEVTNCAKLYNAEDDEFAQRMKKEASKYKIDDGIIVSDSYRYQKQTTSSGYVTPTQGSTVNEFNTPNNQNVTHENTPNESSKNDTFEDIIIEEVESNDIDKNINFEVKTNEAVNLEQNNTNASVSQVNAVETSKTKGMFGGIFGAAAAAMGIKIAGNSKDKKESGTK